VVPARKCTCQKELCYVHVFDYLVTPDKVFFCFLLGLRGGRGPMCVCVCVGVCTHNVVCYTVI
jgi:hypothetical protein